MMALTRKRTIIERAMQLMNAPPLIHVKGFHILKIDRSNALDKDEIKFSLEAVKKTSFSLMSVLTKNRRGAPGSYTREVTEELAAGTDPLFSFRRSVSTNGKVQLRRRWTEYNFGRLRQEK